MLKNLGYMLILKIKSDLTSFMYLDRTNGVADVEVKLRWLRN